VRGVEHPASSTEIRRRVAAGESLDGFTPPAVADYIAAHGLYRETP
jgi:nicotinate-nucleotide adenylyltransferase